MEKYYKMASDKLMGDDIEGAISLFISGVDNGEYKCAFGLLWTVFSLGSYTFTLDEAIEIYESVYSELKNLAENGDSDAMIMVAEGIRYGFVYDDDQPYLYWLHTAGNLGNPLAEKLICEVEEDADGFSLWSAECDQPEEEVERLLNGGLEGIKDHALFSEVDELLMEQYGILEELKQRKATEAAMRSKRKRMHMNSE